MVGHVVNRSTKEVGVVAVPTANWQRGEAWT